MPLEKRLKLLGFGLTLSVALNLFLGGFMVARLASPPPPPKAEELSFRWSGLEEGLDGNFFEEVEAQLATRRGELNAALNEYRATQEEIRHLMEAETVNQEALRAAYLTLSELNVRLQMPFHEAMVDLAPTLDAETRRELLMNLPRLPNVSFSMPQVVNGKGWRFEFERGLEITDEENGEIYEYRILDGSDEESENSNQTILIQRGGVPVIIQQRSRNEEDSEEDNNQ